jgi:hypothetical protein
MFFIIIEESDEKINITIIKEKMITFSIDKTEKEIDNYAFAIYEALDFFNECEVNVFTGNIFVTNALNEWIDKVSHQHESWMKVVDKQTERKVVLKGFTAYKKILTSL